MPSTPLSGSDAIPSIPEGDTKLAALAVLEKFCQGDQTITNALIDSMDDRELLIGTLEVAKTITTMFARSTRTSEQEIISHLRSLFVELISDGTLSADLR